MKAIIAFFPILFTLSFSSENKSKSKDNYIIANGQMPNLAEDKNNGLHLVYGNGDSIMYAFSADGGISFSKSSLISILPEAYSFAMRGPQISCTNNSVVVSGCTTSGNIYSFYKSRKGTWVHGKNVNDVDTIAKEGLIAMDADGENVFAAWLDLRGNKRNKIYGARSLDGGKTWQKNVLVYASPDTTVCECCKPSVVVKNNSVYVMFRNWLNGNRDLYVTQSNDGGHTFKKPQKLGNGNWKLNGCPMDGGGLVLDKNNKVQTVWRRRGKVYTAVPGMPEIEIGEGKGCTLTTVNGKNVYAWVENGEVVIVKSQAQKKVIVGKGSQPVLKAVDDDHILCVWENEKQIHASVIKL